MEIILKQTWVTEELSVSQDALSLNSSVMQIIRLAAAIFWACILQ